MSGDTAVVGVQLEGELAKYRQIAASFYAPFPTNLAAGEKKRLFARIPVVLCLSARA